MNIEYELRYYPIDKDEIRERLIKNHFELESEEYAVKRKVYQISPGKWIRVRNKISKDNKSHTEVTLKSINDSALIDGTREMNIDVSSHLFNELCTLFDNIFPQSSYQESLRETWHLKNAIVTIDTWPGLEPLVEIEAITSDEVYAAGKLLDLKNNFPGDIPQIYEKVYGLSLDEFHDIKNLSFSMNFSKS